MEADNLEKLRSLLGVFLMQNTGLSFFSRTRRRAVYLCIKKKRDSPITNPNSHLGPGMGLVIKIKKIITRLTGKTRPPKHKVQRAKLLKLPVEGQGQLGPLLQPTAKVLTHLERPGGLSEYWV